MMKEAAARIYRRSINQFDRVRYWFVFNKFRHFTMIPSYTYISNLELCRNFSLAGGAVVECGTWKGGMIAGIAQILGKSRNYFLFDSFEGLPDAKEVDGSAAREWQADKTSPLYFNNCTASFDDANAAMNLAGIKKPSIVKGWFNETLPKSKIEEGIAILRMDGDWYESTMDILNNLFYQVNKGGVIIIDDYYMWDGCSKAVHDFLSANKCTERISSHNGVCYIVKC